MFKRIFAQFLTKFEERYQQNAVLAKYTYQFMPRCLASLYFLGKKWASKWECVYLGNPLALGTAELEYNWLLNNDHLSSTATIIGSKGWSLIPRLSIIKYQAFNVTFFLDDRYFYIFSIFYLIKKGKMSSNTFQHNSVFLSDPN